MARQQGILGCLLALAIGYCTIHQSYSKAMTKEEEGKMMKIIKSCQESTPDLDQEEMKDMMGQKGLPQSHAGKCFMKCMSEKMDAGMDSNGKFDVVSFKAYIEEAVEEQATREKMEAMMLECKAAEPSDDDPCENAAKNIECMKTKFDAAGLKWGMS